MVLLHSAKSDLVYNIMAKQEWGSARDEVMDLYEYSEMVLSIYTERYLRGDYDIDDDETREKFLANLMQAFVDHDPMYSLHYTYLGTPDGRFLGVGWAQNETSWYLKVGTMNEGTDFELRQFPLNAQGERINEDDPILNNEIYDPRCRVWYRNAMKYTFNGTVDQAFPFNDIYDDNRSSFQSFIESNHAVVATENCAQSRQLFAEMFGIELSEETDSIISDYTDYADNIYIYDPSSDTKDGEPYKLVWSRYIFYTLNQIGLTASAAIQDPVTGDLFGVLGVDFTLGQLSYLLYDTVKQYETSSVQLNSEDNVWYAWAFEANSMNQK